MFNMGLVDVDEMIGGIKEGFALSEAFLIER
jgi:hypothetical protein